MVFLLCRAGVFGNVIYALGIPIEADPVPAGPLRMIKGPVGLIDEGFLFFATPGIGSNADAQGAPQGDVTRGYICIFNGFPDTFGRRSRAFAVCTDHPNGKFLAAVTRHEINASRHFADGPGNALERDISDRVSMLIVYFFEIVYVEEQKRKILILSVEPPEFLFNLLHEGPVVQETGQAIGVGHVPYPLVQHAIIDDHGYLVQEGVHEIPVVFDECVGPDRPEKNGADELAPCRERSAVE